MKTQFGYFDKDMNVVKTIEVDVHTINSSDPLAFAYGVSSGKQLEARLKANWKIGHLHGSPFRELAPEYLRGFLLGCKGFLVPEGTKIRLGYERCYALFDKRIPTETIIKSA